MVINTEGGKSYSFEEVESFTYLGTAFTRTPEIRTEIQTRLMAGNKCIYSLGKMLRRRNISRKTKMRIYKSVIRPVVTYASELWSMNGAEQERLRVWERKVLRKIFRGKMEDGVWKRRTNQELMEMYENPNIVSVIKSQRLRWLGHVERMAGNRLPKAILQATIGGKKRRGRPRTRWWREVKKDLEQLKITGWRKKAANRNEWRRIINQAMGLLGSQG